MRCSTYPETCHQHIHIQPQIITYDPVTNTPQQLLTQGAWKAGKRQWFITPESDVLKGCGNHLESCGDRLAIHATVGTSGVGRAVRRGG